MNNDNQSFPDLTEVLVPARKLAKEAAMNYAVSVLKGVGIFEVLSENDQKKIHHFIQCHPIPDKPNHFGYYHDCPVYPADPFLMFTEILEIVVVEGCSQLKQEFILEYWVKSILNNERDEQVQEGI